MASKDLLEKLFDVEHEAEAIVSEARDEAGRRLDAAKVLAQEFYTEAYDKALAKALHARESSEEATKVEYASELEVYRVKLEASRLDSAAFTIACKAALEKAIPTATTRGVANATTNVVTKDP